MSKICGDVWGPGRSKEAQEFLAVRGKALAFEDYLTELRNAMTGPRRRYYVAKKMLFAFSEFLNPITRFEALVIYRLGEPPNGGGGMGGVVLTRGKAKKPGDQR